MTKFLSLLISFALLFTSVTPSYAQAMEGVRRDRARVKAVRGVGDSRQVMKFNYVMPQDNTRNAAAERVRQTVELRMQALEREAKILGTLPQEVDEAVKALSADAEEIDGYAVFKEQYKSMLSAEYNQAVKEARTDEERALLKQAYLELNAEKAVKDLYERDYKKVFEQAEEKAFADGLKHVQRLAERIYETGQKNPGLVLNMVTEALPVFASVGAVSPKVKSWAAGLLRGRLYAGYKNCGALGFMGQLKGEGQKRQKECESVLKAAAALAVLGESGNSEDAEALGALFKAGYNGMMGPSVIMVTAAGLLAMGGEDILTGELHAVAKALPDIGLLGKDFSFISLRDWVKASKNLWEQGDWAIGQEYSFYRTEDKALGNAWTDLGAYLAELSKEKSSAGAAAREVLDRMAQQTVIVGKGGSLGIQFPAFMSGALAGGYRLRDMSYNGMVMNGQGKSYQVDNRADWAELNKKLEASHINLTGYAAASMYFRGKSDLDPYTKLAVNNMLVDAYVKSGNTTALEGMSKQGSPSQREIASYQNWQKAGQVAGGIDIVLAVVGTVALGAGLVKGAASGAKALGQMGRAFRIARAGAGAKGFRSTLAGYNRVVRLGRLQKYGTNSLKNIFTAKLADATGVARIKLEAPVKQLRAAKAQPAELTPEMRAAGEEWLRATREMERSKIQAAQEWAAAHKTAPAEKPVTQSAAAAATNAGAASSVSPAYVPTPVRNALGQEVMGWKPVNAIPPLEKPSLWKSWKANTAEWWEGFKYDAGNLFGDLGRAFRRKSASVALALSLNLTPLPSAGIQGFLRAESGLNSLVRTEQVFTGTRSLLTEGAALTRTATMPSAAAPALTGTPAATNALRTAEAVQAASTGQAVRTASAPLRLNLASMVPFSANAENLPGNSLLAFSPVAVTPQEERRLGLGNFFKFNIGKPKFLTDYLKEWGQYEQVLSVNGQDPQQVAFQELQQRKMQYTLNQNATQLYWQRAGYPLTGTIQSRLAGAWEGNYLYNIAPWVYRNNPYYIADVQATNQRAEQAQQAQQTAQEQPVVAQQPAASGNSGYLYSGLPIFAFADTFKSIRNVYRQVSANRHARGVLGRKKPLATELRDILGNQNVSEKYKKQALLRLYGEFNVFDQIIKTLPEESQTVISHYTKAGDNEGLSSVLYSLYQGKVFDQPLTHLSNHIPIEQFSQELDEIIASPEFYAESHMVYDDTPMLSAESNLFTGVVRSLQEVNREAVLKASRVKGWAAQNASSGVEVKGGWIYYKNDIPVYYRYADGTLSATPVAVLHQEPSSWLAAILSKIPLVPLSSPIGMKVPKGMVLALDENGKFKYVRQPGHLAEMLSSKAGRKNMKDLYEQGSNAVEVDTPYSTTDLLAIAKMLEASPNVNFQITLNESSSFKQFVNMLGMFFGMNVDSVMVAPFKKAAGDVESPVVQSTAPNMFGGVGYVTPRAAGELVPHMQKWGMDKSTFTILTLSLGTLLLSWAAGINGITPTDHFSLPVLALPMVVLVLASSLLRSSAPLLLNHYKDPQMRTAANLQMSTFQQLSRVVLAGVTFLWPMLIAGGNDFVAVPAAAFMAAVTLGLFLNTPMWKNVSASIQNLWKHPKSVLPSLWAGLKVAMPSLGKGLLSGIMAPFIDAWNGIKDKITSKGTTYSDDDEGRYKQAYDEEFLTQQETKDSLQRVTLAYASYAASVMLLNQVAGTALGGWGQAAVTLFAVASLLVRHNASKWVAKGKFTDDQLTGISFSGLALMPLALGLLPYDGGVGWMIALVAAGIGLNMSTAVPGQLDNTRLQNNVTATMQERKNKVLQDQSLTAEQKKAKIADLEKMEKYWAGWASKAYSKANANGIYGIYAAVIASGVLSMIPGDWSGLAARIIFLYAAAVAAAGAWKTKGMAGSFLKALFTKRQSVNITEEDMLSGSVSYKTFNISEDKKKATTMLMDLWKGKSNSIKTLRNKLAPYGVVTIASEVKMTDILKRMIEIHNRLVALSEVLGYANVKPAFEDLYILAQDYEQVLEQSQLSESLNREFDKLILSLTGSESLDFGVAEAPVYMEEGQFALPARHQDFLRAKDLINELEVLAKNIKRGGSAVTSDTYGQFIRYHEAAKKLLQEYAFANPSETLRVKTEEKRLGAICRGLKLSNEKSNTLWNNAGPVSDKDVQTLEDILQAY